jgi:hypothetical protein
MDWCIFPMNQPMVFNPSNPNAPPIYPCGVCHKEVHDNEQAILCESGCNFWKILMDWCIFHDFVFIGGIFFVETHLSHTHSA